GEGARIRLISCRPVERLSDVRLLAGLIAYRVQVVADQRAVTSVVVHDQNVCHKPPSEVVRRTKDEPEEVVREGGGNLPEERQRVFTENMRFLMRRQP